MSVQLPNTYEELVKLAGIPVTPVNWRLHARLLIDGENVDVVKVTELHYIGDYGTECYSQRFIALYLDQWALQQAVESPNKLQIELIRIQQSAEGTYNSEVSRESQIFDAMLTDGRDPNIMAISGRGHRTDKHTEQLSDVHEVWLQLIEPIVSEMYLQETGGVFKNVNLHDLIQYLLGYGLTPSPNKTMLEDPTYTGIRGVDVVEPDNKKTYDQIVIPNGTRLFNIPDFLQSEYGVYSSGLGWHIDYGRCFVFPLLKYTDYGKRHRMLTVLNVPMDEVPTLERTFIIYSNSLYIFATGNTKQEDLTQNIQRNLANGFRFSHSGDLVDEFREATNNKAIYTSASTVKAYLLDRRPNDINNVRFVEDRFTANPFPYASKISASLGTKVTVNWDNADPSLIYPGMQLEFLYKKGDEIKKLYGILMSVTRSTRPATRNVQDRHYITSCKLTFHLKRIPEVML